MNQNFALTPHARSKRFDWLMAVTGIWAVFGAYLDAWAHTNVPDLETFFTPWHAVLYSGLLVSGGILVTVWLRSGGGIRHVNDRMPRGYGLSLLGSLLFLVGGVLDMIWHLVFGIEQNFAALLSPTHLLLMTGVGLIVTGPLRSALYWCQRCSFPGVVSAALLLAVLSFYGQFSNPYIQQMAANGGSMDGMAEAFGVLGILLQAGSILAVTQVLLVRLTLPMYAFTLILGLNVVGVTLIQQPSPEIAVGIFGGICMDILYRLLRPHRERVIAFRIFSTVALVPLYTGYFISIMVTNGIWWEVHVWVGAILSAALLGWLMSYLTLPTRNGDPYGTR